MPKAPRTIMNERAMDFLVEFFDSPSARYGKGEFAHEIQGIFKLRETDSSRPVYLIMHPNFDSEDGHQQLIDEMHELMNDEQVVLFLDNNDLYDFYSQGELWDLQDKLCGIVMTEESCGSFFDISHEELSDILLKHFPGSVYKVGGEEFSLYNGVICGCVTGLFPVIKRLNDSVRAILDLPLIRFNTNVLVDEDGMHMWSDLDMAEREAIMKVLDTNELSYEENP